MFILDVNLAKNIQQRLITKFLSEKIEHSDFNNGLEINVFLTKLSYMLPSSVLCALFNSIRRRSKQNFPLK